MGRLIVEAGDQSDRIILVGLAVDSRPHAAQLFRALTMLCKDEALGATMALKLGGSSSRTIDRGAMWRIVVDYIGSRSYVSYKHLRATGPH